MTGVKLIASLVFVCAFVGSSARAQFLDDRQFEEWYEEAWEDDDSALNALLDAQREALVERAATDGLLPVLREVRDEAAMLSAAVGSKDATDLAALRSLMSEAVASAEQWSADIAAQMAANDTAGDEVAVSNALLERARQIALLNPFELMGPSESEPFAFVIDEAGDDEIRTAPTSTSRAQKEIWRLGWMVSALIGEAQLPAKEATAATAQLAADRWNTFMDSVVADQFFWETLFNSWVGERLPRIGGSLMNPPRRQFRIFHPTPVLAYSTEQGSEADARLAVEVFGLRRYRAESFEPRDGVSLIAIIPGDRDEDTGWGLLWTQRRFSFGLARQEFDDGTDVTALVVGMDFARELRNEGSRFRRRFESRIACFRATAEARVATLDPREDSAAAEAQRQRACVDDQ